MELSFQTHVSKYLTERKVAQETTTYPIHVSRLQMLRVMGGRISTLTIAKSISDFFLSWLSTYGDIFCLYVAFIG